MTPANHENEDWINGEKTEDIVAFLDRLYTAKRKVEKRIVVLGGESEPVCTPSCSRYITMKLMSFWSRGLPLCQMQNPLLHLVCR